MNNERTANQLQPLLVIKNKVVAVPFGNFTEEKVVLSNDSVPRRGKTIDQDVLALCKVSRRKAEKEVGIDAIA